jgi:hypothetical protein
MKLKRFISITINAKWTVLVINCINIDIICFMYVVATKKHSQRKKNVFNTDLIL